MIRLPGVTDTRRRPAARGVRTGVRWSFAGALLPALLVLVGCSATGSPPAANPSSPPFADCAALTAPPAAAPTPPPTAAGPTGTASAAATNLPDLRLPCFTGGAEVRLSEIRGPAVVNLWASWCPPCRRELPAFQRLAAATGGRLHVVGVDTRDDRESAAALGAHLGLTFPTLEDRDERLRVRLAAPGLPITVFADGQGRIRHVDASGALDDARLRSLVQRHLEVSVPS